MTPWLEKTWCIPPDTDADFVCHMEDVLELNQEPYDPKRPVVCMDEASKQLIGETRTPIAAEPGQPERVDYEYERLGVCNEFMFCEPLRGWRHVTVTQRRTAKDWAYCVRELMDVHYREAEPIRLVLHNLNTHVGAALYEVFPPEEARRFRDRLEFHYTPKHGSWLNIAEIEIGIMNRQCLNRHMEDRQLVQREVATWEEDRNTKEAKVRWTFTVSKARVKLKRIYPSIEV